MYTCGLALGKCGWLTYRRKVVSHLKNLKLHLLLVACLLHLWLKVWHLWWVRLLYLRLVIHYIYVFFTVENVRFFFLFFFHLLLPQTLYIFNMIPQNTTSCVFIQRIYWELQRVFCNVDRSSSVLDFGSEPIRDILVISLIIRRRLLCVWLQRQTTRHRTPGSRSCKTMLRGGG